MALAAERVEVPGGQRVVVPLEKWVSLTNKQKLNIRDSAREVIIEDKDHGFPWTPERRHQVQDTPIRELTHEEKSLLAEVRGISLEPPHFLPHLHLNLRHAS